MRAPCLLLLVACADDPGPAPEPAPFTVVTFNTGTSEGLPHDAAPDDGYGPAQAAISDAWYGDGLAWAPAIEAARAFLAGIDADVVGFQEVFHPDDCAAIPEEARAGFVCETWAPGDPTVAQEILGEGWQVACHLGKPDKCLGVRRAFGTFAGCAGDLCLDGLAGGEVAGCGSGSRVGRGVIERTDGTTLTVAHVHGSSGITPEDQECRRRQVDQGFVDLGDGAPAADGPVNVVLGDLNTDPGRWVDFDPSAARWADFVGGGAAFDWVTEAGPDAPRTYQQVATIDHVASDAFTGSCWHPGVTDGRAPVLDAVYFDHAPAVCALTPR